MIKKGKLFKRTCIGIDIGSYSVKVLEVVSEQEKYKLAKFAVKELPPGPSDEHLLNTIRAIANESNFLTKDVHISLSGPYVTVRFINMPQMSQQDLKNSLKYEADKYIPFSVDEVIIDSCILGEAQEKAQMRVLLAAAKKEIVNKRIDLFKHLGYNVKLIDVDSFAVFNAFLTSEKTLDKEKSIALINLGHRYTNVIVSKGHIPYFTRDIQIGGEQIDKAISNKFNIEEVQAAKLKSEPQDKADEVKEIVKVVLNNLMDEIRLSFGYYENQYGRAIDQIYISGGLVGTAGLVHYFEENLGIVPQIWDSFRNFDLGEGLDKEKFDKIKSSLAVACGLVVRKGVM